MSDYIWCHGPDCHKRQTTTRVRGVKGSKVLRTRKVPYNSHCAQYYKPYVYFCDQTCLMDFLKEHIEEFVQLHPRTECLETPITDPKKTTHTSENSWGNHSWTTTDFEIVGVDNG